MDSSVATGLVGAGSALFGAIVGGAVSYAVERRRNEALSLEARRAELRSACSDFTAAIARVRHHSHSLPVDPGALPLLVRSFEEARVGCERLRILVSSSATQQSARVALRHAYAVWKFAETGVDPRPGEEVAGPKPHQRLRKELTTLYKGVRRELGVPDPDDVFEDLDD